MSAITNHCDETRLLLELRNGDAKAFNQVFLTYYAAVCHFAARWVGVDSAEDIAEEVFLKLWKANVLFDNTDHLKAYLFRSVRHSCLNYIKKNQRYAERNSEYVDIHIQSEDTYLGRIMQTEVILQLYKAIESLPEQTAKVIQLTYLHGLSNQEAADELNVSVNTIKTQKQRGLNKLRSILPKNQFALLLKLLIP